MLILLRYFAKGSPNTYITIASLMNIEPMLDSIRTVIDEDADMSV